MNLTPRPYQTKLVDRVLEIAAQRIRARLLVVSPPGSGKSLMAAMLMRALVAEMSLRGLTWAHRRELVHQMVDHFVENGISPEMIAVMMARDPRRNDTAPIQCTTVDTLYRRAKPLADFIISDEAHRDGSEGRRALCGVYPDALIVGFTGSPVRLDGRMLVGPGCEYDEMIVAAYPSELIAEGWLAVPRIITVPKEYLPDLRGLRKKGRDWDQAELEDRANRRALVGNIVEHWLEHAEGRRTIVFPVGVKHSHAIVAKFQAAGIPAAHIDANTPHRERILNDLRSGKLLVVSSCGVLSEGTDIPPVKCVVLARPTESLALALQQPGRCMRPWEGVEPLILDHAGVIRRHGLPYADRPWEEMVTPDGAASESWKKGRTPSKECPKCHTIMPAGRTACVTCATVLLDPEPVPNEQAVKLEELSFSDGEKAAELDRLRAFASARGLRDGWAEKVYQAKFRRGAAEVAVGGA